MNTTNLEKSRDTFNRILEFHSQNRPPFSYEIFNPDESEIIKNFAENSFFRNYSIFESIFKFEVSICFYSISPETMPVKDTSKKDEYTLKQECLKPTEELPQILKDVIDNADLEITETEEKEEKKKEEGEKSDEEKEDERRVEELRQFMDSFYNNAVQYDQVKNRKNEEIEKAKKEKEHAIIREMMNEKIAEIHKEVDEKLTMKNKDAFDAADQVLAEKDKTKKK